MEKKNQEQKVFEFSQWSGKWSFRVRIFGLFFGANLRRLAAFIIYNGKRHCWQIQTWSPRLAYWRNGLTPHPADAEQHGAADA